MALIERNSARVFAAAVEIERRTTVPALREKTVASHVTRQAEALTIKLPEDIS